MAVSFVRIDDRMIHGQTVTRWAVEYPCDGIIAVNDAAASNPVLKSAYKSAAPDKKTFVWTMDHFKEKAQTVLDSNTRYFLITKNPLDMAEILVNFGFVPGDADALYEILGDGQTMQYVEPAFDREKTVKFLNETCVGNKNAYVAVELKDSGRLIGYIMLKPCGERQLEAGWIFNKDYRGMGYACESVGAAFDHAFTELGAFSVTAGIDERNEASLKLARSLGMKFTSSERENGNTLLRYVKTKGNK